MRKTEVRLSANIAEGVAQIVEHLKDQSCFEDRSISSRIPDKSSAIVSIESEDDGHVGTLLREVHHMATRMGFEAEVVEDDRSGDEVFTVWFTIDRDATEDEIRTQIDIVLPMACPLRRKVPKYKVIRTDDKVGINSDCLATIDLHRFISEHGDHIVGENLTLSLVE